MNDQAWVRARQSSRRYELLTRDRRWVICRVRPWQELFTHDDANQAVVQYLRLESSSDAA
jgi:hypothetical protein